MRRIYRMDAETGEILGEEEVEPVRDEAWYKVHKQHYPYIERGPMPPDKLAWITELLEAHPFRFAKTIRDNSHWHTLRHEWWDVGDVVYTEVVTATREHGYTEYVGTYPWRMLNVDGYKYWSHFSSAPHAVFIVNRKPLGALTPEEEADLHGP